MRFILLAIAVLGFLAGAPSAAGCSCLPPSPPEESLGKADAVFSGRVVRINEPGFGPIQSTSDPRFVEFQIYRSWKGPLSESITVVTARDSAACGFYFLEGEEYLVYAQEFEGELRAGLCSRTARLSDATEDLTALGQGQAPLPEEGPSRPQNRPSSIVWGILIGAAVGIWYVFRHPKKAS